MSFIAPLIPKQDTYAIKDNSLPESTPPKNTVPQTGKKYSVEMEPSDMSSVKIYVTSGPFDINGRMLYSDQPIEMYNSLKAAVAAVNNMQSHQGIVSVMFTGRDKWRVDFMKEGESKNLLIQRMNASYDELFSVTSQPWFWPVVGTSIGIVVLAVIVGVSVGVSESKKNKKI